MWLLMSWIPSDTTSPYGDQKCSCGLPKYKFISELNSAIAFLRHVAFSGISVVVSCVYYKAVLALFVAWSLKVLSYLITT